MGNKVKMKTRKGVAKRFKLTGKGKVKRQHAYASHILTKKSSKRKRKLRAGTLVSKEEMKTIKKMIPYK